MRIAVAGGTGTVGRHVVAVGRERGHDILVLSRATGADLVAGTNLDRILIGADAVIDVTSIATQSARASREFFGTVTGNLLDAEQRTGVGHHLALSIVGSDRAPFGYYAGKAEQEQRVRAGRVPWTILRATQFHEFAAQLYERFHVGPVALVPTMHAQPVAAKEVAARLLDLAESGPAAQTTDLGGPEKLRMVDMVRAYLETTERRARVWEVPLPGGFGRAMRDGTILPSADADHGTQTFAQWVSEQPDRG